MKKRRSRLTFFNAISAASKMIPNRLKNKKNPKTLKKFLDFDATKQRCHTSLYGSLFSFFRPTDAVYIISFGCYDDYNK